MIEVHHLNNSRSQRVLWMIEELGTPYQVIRYERDPKTNLAPPELKAIHPLGKSPVIRDGESVLAESGAIIEYLVERYGNGRFVPQRGTREHETYRYWIHYAEGSLMMQELLKLYLGRVGEAANPVLERVNDSVRMHVAFVEKSLGASQFLTGSAFTAADVQMSFPLEVAVVQGMLGEAQPRLSALLARLHARPAAAAWQGIAEASDYGSQSPQSKPSSITLFKAWANPRPASEDLLFLNPGWPAYDDQRRATMVFNVSSKVVDDPDRELRLLLSQLPPRIS